MKIKGLPIALVAAALALPASADMLIDGQVSAPRRWSLADLQAQSPVAVDTVYLTGHGEEHGRYRGVPLWALLAEAKLTDQEGKHPDLRHAVLVTGRDGYAVIVSFGEIDPDFEDKTVLIAYERDGKPLDGLQLIMPGDKRGGRYVHDVVHIDVK
jgi:DMSO/TMAO reductase YedYZ molybdopterin-dependent catalytic subunit